jgi:putative salt-induced outer membrane protein YdiY
MEYTIRKNIYFIVIVGFLFFSVTTGFAEEKKSEQGEWEGSVELSLITVAGNSNAQTGSAKAEAIQDNEIDRWIARGGGIFARSDGVKSAEYFYANGEYNYKHTAKTYSSYFLGWEKDPLAGLDGRITARVGVGHEFMKSDKDLLLGETSIAYVYENEEDETNSFPEGRLFGLYEHHFHETASFFQEVEWLQDMTLLRNYRINSVTGLKLKINTSWSLKTSVTIHYDHEPAKGFLKTDTITETALVYKF